MQASTFKFRNLKLATMTYPAVIRWAVSGFAYLIGLLATRQRQLAHIPAQRIRDPHNQLSGWRLLSWYIRRRWPALHWLSKYKTLDFTAKLHACELDAMQPFILGLGAEQTQTSDQMFIAARRLEAAEGRPEWPTAHADFITTCNRYLAGTVFTAGDSPILPKKTTHHFNRADAHAALTALADAVPLTQQPWFVISGTFLGLVREGDFLAHDYDIDVGLMAADLELDSLLDKLWARRDFAVLKVDIQPAFLGSETDQPRPALITIIHKTGIQIDIFIHHPGLARDGSPVLWHGSSLHRWENTPFALGNYQMHGLDLLGPVDADDYLTECYGDWRTPVTAFNCSTDTSNLVLVPHPSTVAFFLRQVVTQYSEHGPNWPKLLAEVTQNGFIAEDQTMPGRYHMHPALFEVS